MENEDSPSRPSVIKSEPTVSKLLLTPKQQEAQNLLRSGPRHTLLVGGARSGKTTLLVNEIAERAVKSGNSRHVILRYRFNAVRPSIALDTLPKVFRLGFPGEPIRHHRTDGYFSLEKNGSEIWFGGLDDNERVEKILGKEYATIFFNECSQIGYSSVLVALTRLAQVVDDLQQAAYYDLNPTNKGHWTNVLFGDKRDPVSRQPLDEPDDYAWMFLNPRDNPNLTETYLKSLERLPERARKRFYEGAYVDNLDGALFSYEAIARARVAELPIERRSRVVVAVDPSGSRGEDDARDEIGIVVAALGDDKHAYVLADRSLRDAPAVWGGVVVQACRDFLTDQIVAEENFGGDMVRHVIHTANPNVHVQMVSASRGKVLRAEPVSALYEQGKVHHVGRFAVLEDQLCAFTTSGYRGEGSPDHADALVFAISELMLKETAPLLEYYRRLAQDRERERDHIAEPAREESPRGAHETVLAPDAESVMWLKAPEGISGAHGISGAFYVVDDQGLIAVKTQDAPGLINSGLECIVKDGNE
jgi:hypothetical protein